MKTQRRSEMFAAGRNVAQDSLHAGLPLAQCEAYLARMRADVRLCRNPAQAALYVRGYAAGLKAGPANVYGA